MEIAHLGESWRDLYVMLGSSSAALLGLLFVATSLHLDEIAQNPHYQIRARSNIYQLGFTLIEAAIMLRPQPRVVLGGILAAANLVMLSFPLKNAYLYLVKDPELGRRGGWLASRAVAFILSFVLGIAGGAVIAVQHEWGLYLVTAGYLLMLATVTLNSWSIMVGIGRFEEKMKKGAGH